MEERERAAGKTLGVVRGMARWEIRDRSHHAQRSIVTATLACIARSASVPDAGGAEQLPPAAPIRLLQRAVEDYAHILAALGHDAQNAGELARQAVRDAPTDGAPPSLALLDAARRWAEAAARSSAPR